MVCSVIVASVMRMIALNPASKVVQADMTYIMSTSNAFLWTQVESCVAIICVCLPTLKGLVVKFVPRLFSTSGRATSNGYNGYNLDEMDNNHWKDKNPRLRSTVKAGLSDDSQERIIGIKRTVDVSIVNSGEGDTTASNEEFRAGPRI